MHRRGSSLAVDWPPLGDKVSALDFSRQGGMLAIGNETGRAPLARLGGVLVSCVLVSDCVPGAALQTALAKLAAKKLSQ